MYKFKFADIGEGLHEGLVGEIYVKDGDKVSEGDSLFGVETDKVSSDIPSPVDGVIKKILIKTGETVHVGDITMHIDDGKGDQEEPQEEKIEKVEKKVELAKKTVTVQAETKVQNFKTTGVFATPYARKLAAEKNIDIKAVKGSGFNGRVLAADILSGKISTSTSQSSIGFSMNTKVEPYVQKITPIRKAIAKAMKRSSETNAYTHLVAEVNMSPLWKERKALVEEVLASHNIKVSFTALIAMATIKALRKFPVFNSKLNQEANTLESDGTINLGIAVDTPKGLVVPTIKNAESKSVIQIAEDINNFVKKARDGKLTGEDMSRGTFTITNFGTAGALWGSPVINTPELAILGIGAIVDRVQANDNGNFYLGKVMNLTVAADHKWIDGADIGRFNAFIKKLLENPILLLGGY